MSSQLNIELSKINAISSETTRLDKLWIFAKSYPEFVKAWLTLSRYYLTIGDKLKSKEVLDLAYEKNDHSRAIILELVKHYTNNDNFDKSQNFLDYLLDKNDKDLIANFQLALLRKKQGKNNQAIELLHKVLKIDPRHRAALINLGISYQRTENYPKAISIFQMGKKLYPENYQFYFGLGQLARLNLDFRQALEYFEKASKRARNKSESTNAELQRAEVLFESGQISESQNLAIQLSSNEPQNIKLLMFLGSLYKSSSNYEEAIEVYERILKIRKDHTPATIQLSNIYKYAGQLNKAVDILKSDIENQGENYRNLIYLGSLFEAQTEHEKAFSYYKKALLLKPNKELAYYNIANLLFLMGKARRALSLLDKAQLACSKKSKILVLAIRINLQLGNIDLCKNLLLKFEHLNAEDKVLIWLQAKIFAKEGKFKNAISLLEGLVGKSKVWIRRKEIALAEAYMYDYNFLKSLVHYEKASKCTLAPQQERNRMALIYLLNGQIDKAMDQLKESTKELKFRKLSTKVTLPLKSHVAILINEFRIRPDLMNSLAKSNSKNQKFKLKSLHEIFLKDNNYLGSSLLLAKELRKNGILSSLANFIRKNPVESKIPKIIFQYWNEDIPPKDIQELVLGWRKNNPSYTYRLYSRKRAIQFIRNNYGAVELAAFERCKDPASQSDFFRLAYLNKLGGIYVDIDDKCIKPLDELLASGAEMILKQEYMSSIGNNFIASVPKHTIINDAFNKVVENLDSYFNENAWFKTGPAILTKSFCKILVPYIEDNEFKNWPRINCLSQSEIREFICEGIPLSYKNTSKSWSNKEYKRKIRTKI